MSNPATAAAPIRILRLRKIFMLISFGFRVPSSEFPTAPSSQLTNSQLTYSFVFNTPTRSSRSRRRRTISPDTSEARITVNHDHAMTCGAMTSGKR